MRTLNHWKRGVFLLTCALLAWLDLPLGGKLSAAPAGPSWEHPPHRQTTGVFWREHWYERGLTNANPAYDRRFRINAPATSLHPQWGRRIEARENGMMLVKAEEDLFQAIAAEFYAELWGGHPGTGQKRIHVNGRSTYALPRVGTEDGECTYSYPVIRLALSDLVNGYNAFQWTLDQGMTFWAHALVDNACLRIALTNQHPDLVKLNLAGFDARVRLQPARAENLEALQLAVDVPAGFASRIKEVAYQGWYSGYDDNGDLRELDWHGFTLDRRPMAQLGSATHEPFHIAWNTAMLPAQANVAVRAFVRFNEAPGLVYVTAATTGLAIDHPPGTEVRLFRADDVPPSFWSRAGRARRCAIHLDLDPAEIERAELYVITWTGGAGKVKDYFKLNGRHLPVAEGSAHVIQFNRMPIEPGWLRRGANEIELLSDTEHHGIEIIYPGPALMVRYGK